MCSLFSFENREPGAQSYREQRSILMLLCSCFVLCSNSGCSVRPFMGLCTLAHYPPPSDSQG